jgi:hypothetical protein
MQRINEVSKDTINVSSTMILQLHGALKPQNRLRENFEESPFAFKILTVCISKYKPFGFTT